MLSVSSYGEFRFSPKEGGDWMGGGHGQMFSLKCCLHNREVQLIDLVILLCLSLIMYRALYDFSSTHKNILKFKTGDQFLGFEAERKLCGEQQQANAASSQGWIYVIDRNLKNGFVPETYVKAEEAEGDVSRFTEQLIVIAKQHLQEAEGVSDKERCSSVIRQLQNKLGVYSVPKEASSRKIEECSLLTKEPVPQNSKSSEKKIVNQDSRIVKEKHDDIRIPDLLGCELIEHVKRETGLGHKQARMAIEATLEFLNFRIPNMKHTTTAVLTSIKGTSPSGEALKNTHDWQRLKCIFSTILDVTNDVEQLNWALYEDQHIIIEFLEELITLLTDGDTFMCKQFLQKDQYRDVEALVQYFQMEPRIVIRQVLLKVFAALCTLDRLCITVLVNSDLPLLLARDIKESSHDQPRLVYSCLVLTMLFWTGETMPINHYDVLNVNFVNFILDLMDETTFEEEIEQVTESFTELLLAFNSQFEVPKNNIVMQALMSRNTVKEFLGKLISLTNREDDPVGSMFEHTNPPPNTVHKMLLDIFSNSVTANLFYTSDLKVFIEIIARKLLDLPPEDMTQATYLRLSYNVICNTNYAEHCHCQEEFQQCFLKVLNEETSIPEENKRIVEEICINFSELFHAA